jgi:acylphosphatase
MTRARDVANLIGSGNYSSTTFTATAGQTAFTISHTQGFVQVFMNGLLLDETVDYTSNGSAVTLTSGAAAGDEIEVVAYNTFSVGDALNQAAADTRYVNTSGDTMTGDLSVTGDLFVTNSTNAKLSVSDNISEVGSGNLALQAQNSASSALKPMGFRAEDFRYAIGSNEVMKVDGSGRVTKPYQPFIELHGNNASRVTNHGSVQEFTSFGLQTSVGGMTWNSSNGRITVPVAGKYLFVGKFYLWINNTATHNILTRKNGTSIAEYQTDFASLGAGSITDHTVTTADIINMSANDYVQYRVNADIYAGYPHCNLQAFLLG